MILYVFCIVPYSNYRYLMINEDFWLLHEIYEIAIMIIIAWHVSIGALWRLSQACCLGFPLSSKGLTASGLQLVSAFNTRDVSHRSTEKCRRFESCEQERNCQYIPMRRNILWAEARSLSQAATHSSPQKRKVRRYLPFKWCTGKLMEASYFAPMPHKFIGTYWNRTDPNNIPQYFKKDFLLQVFHLYTMHRRFLRYLKSRQGHCAEERSRCQAACKSRNASCPRCTGSVATLLAWQLDENKSSSVWASWLVAGSQENRDSVNRSFLGSLSVLLVGKTIPSSRGAPCFLLNLFVKSLEPEWRVSHCIARHNHFLTAIP